MTFHDLPSGGPYVVNQVLTVATGWGYAARCGCGWKTAHDTRIAALVAGQRHLRAEHSLRHPEEEGHDASASSKSDMTSAVRATSASSAARSLRAARMALNCNHASDLGCACPRLLHQ